MLRVAKARSIDKPQTSMVIGGSAFPMKAAVIWRMRGQGKGNKMRVISVERENRPTTNLLRRLIRCIRVVVVRVLVGCRRWHRSAEGRRLCVVVRDGKRVRWSVCRASGDVWRAERESIRSVGARGMGAPGAAYPWEAPSHRGWSGETRLGSLPEAQPRLLPAATPGRRMA